jgi:hypothetical protein
MEKQQSSETSVTVTSRHGVTSQKTWPFNNFVSACLFYLKSHEGFKSIYEAQRVWSHYIFVALTTVEYVFGFAYSRREITAS